MKLSIKSLATVSTRLALVVAPLVLSATAALAEPATPTNGTRSSYLGGGLSVGLTDGGQPGDAAAIGGNIQGRYALRNAPVSLRGSTVFTDSAISLMPLVTVDVGVAPNVNFYAGGGYSFVAGNGTTPIGNRDAGVVTIGLESKIAPNVMIYGDAKYGIDAYRNSSASALSLQVGAGFSF